MAVKNIQLSQFMSFGPCMMKDQIPPSRKSNECVVMVKPRGPYQWPRCSALVQALKTSSRGASKVRSRTISRADSGATGLLCCAVIFSFLLLKFLKVLVESIEAFFPEAPVVIQPIG